MLEGMRPRRRRWSRGVLGYGDSSELDASSLSHTQHRQLLVVVAVNTKVDKLWICASERRKPQRFVFNSNISSHCVCGLASERVEICQDS